MLFLSLMILGFFGTTKCAVAFSEMSCESDGDCPVNTFCYLVSNLCSPCKADFCSHFNREDSGWRKCHKDFSECGKCLEGYEQEILTDGSPREACILAQPLTSKDNKKTDSSVYWYIFAFLGVIGIGGAVYIRRRSLRLLRQSRQENMRSSNQNTCYHHDQCGGPPSYSAQSLPHMGPGDASAEDRVESAVLLNKRSSSCESPPIIPTAPPLSVESLPGYLENRGKTLLEKENLCQAVPFRRANYEEEYESGSESAEDGSIEENEDGNTRELELPNFHDENTMPSDWTPFSTSASATDSNCIASGVSQEVSSSKRLSNDLNSDDSGSDRKRIKQYEENPGNSNETQIRPFHSINQNQTNDNELHQIDENIE